MVDIDHEQYQFEDIDLEKHRAQPFHRVEREWTWNGTQWVRPQVERALSGESFERRVLSFITDEVDGAAGGVPRNTPTAVGRVLIGDREVTDDVEVSEEDGSVKVVKPAMDKIDEVFAKLLKAGFIEQRDDGSFERTEAGWVEISN